MKYVLLIAALSIQTVANAKLSNTRGNCQQKVAPADVEACQIWAEGVCSIYDQTNYSSCASTSGMESNIQQTWANAKAASQGKAIQQDAQLLNAACASNVPARQNQVENCPKVARNCNSAKKSFPSGTVSCADFDTENQSGGLDSCSPGKLCAAIQCNAGRVTQLQAQESPQCATGGVQQRVSR